MLVEETSGVGANPGVLYHTRKRGVVAGVCVGVAEHLALRVAVVRLTFVLLALAGPGFLLYGLLWLVTPDERAV